MGIKYSIILPVKNGGEYLKECVASILTQTYKDFNFLILENASTDETLAWLHSQTDPRIRIYSSSSPLSIEENWERIIGITKNEFITLIGHDDILDPGYLAEMNELIARYPDASLYQTHFRYIDSTGKTIRKCKQMPAQQSPSIFLHNILSAQTDICGTGFMMRSKDYDVLGGIPAYPNLLFADFELWVNLTMKSYIAVSAKECFAFRLHQSTTSISSDLKMEKAFERFISYLQALGSQDEKLRKIIAQNTSSLLNFYCQGFTSRILRTAFNKRQGKRVKDVIRDFELYGELLSPGIHFKPLNNSVVRMALFVDSNIITRNFFLLIKKLHTKPFTSG